MPCPTASAERLRRVDLDTEQHRDVELVDVVDRAPETWRVVEQVDEETAPRRSQKQRVGVTAERAERTAQSIIDIPRARAASR
jgi:hypothetical protein